MGNRILKESIRTSETIDELSWFEEVFFYRLIVSCDDYGRFDARPKILKSTCFPLKTITDKDVEKALVKLTAVGLVEVYKVNAKPYLQLTAWSRHQRLRQSKGKYPPSEENDDLRQVAASCGMFPPESESEYESESESEYEYEYNQKKHHANELNGKKTELLEQVDVWFNQFWNLYPKKVGKKAVQTKFKHVCKKESDFKAIMSGLRNQIDLKYSRTDPQYIPNPLTWLNQERWNDVVVQQSKSTGRSFLEIAQEQEIQQQSEHQNLYLNELPFERNGEK